MMLATASGKKISCPQLNSHKMADQSRQAALPLFYEDLACAGLSFQKWLESNDTCMQQCFEAKTFD
jgi:hypothetical protein